MLNPSLHQSDARVPLTEATSLDLFLLPSDTFLHSTDFLPLNSSVFPPYYPRGTMLKLSRARNGGGVAGCCPLPGVETFAIGLNLLAFAEMLTLVFWG